MLMLSGLYPAELRSVNLDFDWVYRKSLGFFYCLMDKCLNSLNAVCDTVLAKGVPSKLGGAFRNFPGLLSANLLSVVWSSFGLSSKEIKIRKEAVMAKIESGSASIGFSAIAAMIALCLLIRW